MPQFLFVVEVPPGPAMSSSAGYSMEWTRFEDEANTILKPVKTCTRLQKNAWLLPAENLWPVLMSMSAAADNHRLSFSVLLVEGAIDMSAKPSKQMQQVPVSGI